MHPPEFDQAVRRLEAAGAQWEIYRETIWRQRIRVQRCVVDLDYRLHERGVALRVIQQRRPGFVFCSPADAASLDRAAGDALTQAALMRPRGAPAFAPARPLPGAPPQAPPDHSAALTGAARAMAAAAGPAGMGIALREPVAQFERRGMELWNSSGLRGAGSLDAFSLSLEVTATDEKTGEKRQAAGGGFSPDAAGLAAELFGRSLARRARQLLGAAAPKPGRYPVVLGGECVVELLEAFAPIYNAEDIAAGRTLAATPEKLRHDNDEAWLHDDPCFPGGYGPQLFDGEGIPAARVTLSAPGRAPGILDTQATAAKARRIPAGTALRDNVKALPRPAARYLVLPAGAESPEALYRAAEGGISITALYGLHTVDLLTGEFALSASGFRLSRGAPAEPLAGFTVSGDFAALLKSIRARGDAPHRAAAGCAPALLLESLRIAV
jgi:PmbA protein